MAADFSRVRLNPLLDYAGVELKQGGVLLDADANELVALIDRRLRALASDTLGRATVSATTPNAFKVSAVAGGLEIDKGRLYVDGLLAENHGAASQDAAQRLFDGLLSESSFGGKIPYAGQPYLPGPPALPTSCRHLVYLDVWSREVTHLEQPALVESAVAVETSSRLQTVWQVRVLAPDAGSGANCATPDAGIADWSELIAPSTGVLSTSTFDVPAADDPCDLPPSGGYRGPENQLYRVEIHNPGQPGGTATFKWSRENASVGSRVASLVSGTALELDSLGRDEVLRISSGDWVEITDDAREFSQAAGEMRRVTVEEATRRISFAPALPAAMLPGSFPDSDWPKKQNLRVRRWDQKSRIFRTDASGTPVQVQDLDAPGAAGLIQVPASGVKLLLESGITISFDTTGAKGFRAGDHWEFAARTSDASVEALDRAPPRGIHHHYARLGLWDVASGTVSDCRNPWPPQGTTGENSGENCGCTQCVTPESHASGQLTLQDAVDKLRDSGGTVCLHAGHYVLREPVRVRGARSLRITGQGPATMIASSGSAFIIERSLAVSIDELAIFSLGRQSAISVRTVLGLALRRLAVAVFGNADAQGAAVTLSGMVAGATLEGNLFIAPDGVRALEPHEEEAPQLLLSAVLHIDDNVFWCRDSAVRLAGAVGHAFETRMSGNQVIGSHEVGLAAEGFALPGGSVRFSSNNLNLHGAGIRCPADGAWIEGNKLQATRDGDRPPGGAGIELAAGLDRNGSNQCQVLANQVSGFPEAGILIAAPVQALIVKLNLIEQCGNGIVMRDSARAASLSIENNQLRGIGLRANAANAGMTLGIGIFRTESATVAGNILRQIGQEVGDSKQLVAGIAAFSVQRPRISGNDILEVGPLDNFGGVVAGISVRAPYAQAEIGQNHVERDAQPSHQPSDIAWLALQIDEPQPGGNPVSRLGRFTALRVDDNRTLVLLGSQAWVNAVPTSVDAAGAAVPVQGASASVLGNVFIARGRAPAVDVSASGDVLFNDNRCELRANFSTSAVLLNTPVALIHANRVRGAEDSIRVTNGNALVAAIGNITTRPINAPLRPEMVPLNLIG